ncbi:MAG: hypothetical protein JJU16_03695 [Alkalibacterium sp.]|nr:hypothetical protein [Alkalibacterium sp.]
MENDPTLHQDQQNQSDYFLKAQGAKESDRLLKNEPGEDGADLSEDEKEKQTKAEDFEQFDLDKLNNTDDDHTNRQGRE